MEQYPSSEEGQRAKARDNEAMFDRIAHRYDVLNRLISFGLDARWRRRMVDLCLLGEGMESLDLCCGTGDVTRECHRRGARASGVDASEAMLAVARRRSSSDITYLHGDALALPFADATFDAVTIAFGNRNVASLPKLYGEMARVTRAGGRVASLEITAPTPRWLSALFFAYFGNVPPLLARLLCVDLTAYQYLPASVALYPPAETVTAIMQQAGLRDIHCERHLAGSITIHCGVR